MVKQSPLRRGEGGFPPGEGIMRRISTLCLTVAVSAFTTVVLAGSASATIAVAETVRVSVDSSGNQGNNNSDAPAISGDGSVVAFASAADSLVPNDTNGVRDVFTHDVATGTTTRVSVDSAGNQADAESFGPVISHDGSMVVYTSSATNLVANDATTGYDVYSYDVGTKTTTRISTAYTGNPAEGGGGGEYSLAISPDGSTIVFESWSNDIVAGDLNNRIDLFAYEVATGTASLVSVDSSEAQADEASLNPSISNNGIVTFDSAATNLVPGDTNSLSDVFARDLVAGTTTRISVDSSGNQADTGASFSGSVSADGSIIVFQSLAKDLVSDKTTGFFDIFTHDVATGATTRISVSASGDEPGRSSYTPRISNDGSTVVYSTSATNLVPNSNNGKEDIFAYEVATGATTRISVDSSGTQADGHSFDPEISGDGSAVVYESFASNLVTGDTGFYGDVFLTVVEQDRFTDDNNSIFESDIEWLAESGITSGCGPTTFCPTDNVTRGQMAAFLVRALNLPATSQDFFTDDDNSIFENNINRLAASGITSGCGPTSYCPTDNVTRGQMAAFLVRGLGYTDNGGGDLFTDDDNSVFEANIDKLATAGVTRGCNPPANTKFCPNNNVTREQMAAFLRRALDA